MSEYVTSDTHFGHANIIEYARSDKFSSLEEMDEYLVRVWNETVGVDDVVYHLGDFAWRKYKTYLEQLNGKIILICGNHDSRSMSGFEAVHKFGFDTKDFSMCHYPMLGHRRRIGLHGHLHDKGYVVTGVERGGLNVNCCVEKWEYEPINLRELKNDLEDM